MNFRTLAVVVVLSSTNAIAQTAVTPYTSNAPSPGATPVTSSSPLPVGVYGGSTATSGKVLTSNGVGALATFQAATGGSVTAVSCSTANGVSCTVANPNTAPALTFTLGSITPSSVNGAAITSSGSTGSFLNAAGTYTTPTGTGITALTGVVAASGSGSVVSSFGSFSSSTLATALTDETGTGVTVFNTGPVLVGPVGIGTANPLYTLDTWGTESLTSTPTITSGSSVGLRVYSNPSPASASSATYNNLSISTQYNGAADTSTAVNGVAVTAELFSNFGANQVSGVRSNCVIDGNSAYNATQSCYSFYANLSMPGLGTYNHIIDFKGEKPSISGTAGLVGVLYAADQTNLGSGTISQSFAVHIEGSGIGNSIEWGNGSSGRNANMYSPSTNVIILNASSGLGIGTATIRSGSTVDINGTVNVASVGSASATPACYSTSSGGILSLCSSPGAGQVTLQGSSGAPTCGTGCASVTSGSTDVRGSFVTGSSITSAALNFSSTLSYTPFCVISDSNTSAVVDISSISTSALSVSLASALSAVTIYYMCAK